MFIYVLDALRPDFLGCYGASGEISPVIDKFSNESVLFKNAYSSSTWTKPAGTSILTGKYPGSVNMDHVYDQLNPNIPILPEILRQNGYNTYGVTAQGFISEKFGLGKGYDQYKNLRKSLNESDIDDARTESGLTSEEKLVLPDSRDLNNAIFPLLNDVKSDLFSFVWSLDTHDPYFVIGNESYFNNSNDHYVTSSELEEFASKYSVEKLKSLYREGIRYNDKQFKEYLDHIKSRGEYEESLIILAGDHGEALGEHGDFGHAGLVHEEQIRIPLIVKFPEQQYAGRNVDTPVSLVDIFNTVLDCIGVIQNKSQDGRSLIATIEGDINNRPIHAETFPNPGVAHSQSVRWEDYKWMSVTYPSVFSDLNPKKIFHRLRKLRRDILWRNERLYDLDDEPSESDSDGGRV